MSSHPRTRSGTTTGVVYLRHSPGHSTNSAFSMTSAGSEKHYEKSFIRRLFHRAGKPRAAAYIPGMGMRSEEFEDEYGDPIIMMPSPHTHPLLSKPYPRDDVRTNNRRSCPPMLGFSFSGIDGVARRILNPSELQKSHDDLKSYHPNHQTSAENLYRRSLREREKAATAAATDHRYIQEWGFFIKCYSEGRFNVSNPPDPPPRRPSFNHLTAPAPPDERQRLKAVKACNTILPTTAQEKCHRLVLLARKVFQTRMACISLIDENLEVVKAEHSFGRKYISRADSIAAHVLLANEPMVILDTAKDWRLKGNPLSQDSPHLRFYAGAPIVTFEGHTIGVFAVFDTQPRSVFPQASRRNLMDFARLAMTEFEMVMEEKASSSASKPSTISTTEASSTLKAPTKDDDSASIISRRGALSKKILKGIEENAEKMPPISPFLQDEPAPISRPQTKSTIAADSPTVPQEDHYPPNQLIYPDDRSSAYSTSSSFALPPPGTPSTILSEEFSPHHQQFFQGFPPPDYGQQHDPVPEFPPRTSSRNPPPPPLCGSPSSRYSDLETSPHSTPMPRYKQFRPNPIFTPRAPSPKSILSAPQSPDVITSMVEATYATSLIARSLDYDFVYLLRVTSTMQSRSNSRYSHLIRRQSGDSESSQSTLASLSLNNQQVSIATKVLVAHGLPDPPPVFDAQLHLRALRSVGGLIFQNPTSSTGSMGLGNSHGHNNGHQRNHSNNHGHGHGHGHHHSFSQASVLSEQSDDQDETQGYQLGILLPLMRDTTNEEECMGGIVLAAFAKKVNEPKIRADEVRFLREFGEAMKDILVKADRLKRSGLTGVLGGGFERV